MKIEKRVGAPATIEMELFSTADCKIQLKGDSCSVLATYFDRFPIQIEKGKNILTFPLPIAPPKICITGKILEETAVVKLKDISCKALPRQQPKNSFEGDFLALSKWFSHFAQSIPYGVIKSPQKEITLKYAHTLFNNDGSIADTPAQVMIDYPYIECSNTIKPHTVAQRMFILCHEFGHFINHSMNEIDADRTGAELYLSAGFPASEAYYALADILPDMQEADMRLYNLEKFLKNG